MAYRVITPPTGEPVTLAEAKANLRVVFDDEDAQISAMITAARQMLEGRINRVLMPQTIEVAAASFDELSLPMLPVRSIDSLSYLDSSGMEQVVGLTAYFFDDYLEPPKITPIPGTTWPAVYGQGSAVRLRYEAGYADAASVPSPLKQWILLTVASLYENRQSLTAGVQTYALPDEFSSMLLQPYMVYV